MATARNKAKKEEKVIYLLGSLPIGTKLIVQCRKDWRAAVVSKSGEERITLQIYSPTGRMYRKGYEADTPIEYDGNFPVLGEGDWRAGLAKYDFRW